jgi:hypothetical protein
MTGMQDDDIDRLLALAAGRGADPSQALMDRVLADALALQPQPVPLARRAVTAPRGGVLSRLAAVFGGGPMLAGLGSVAVAGLVLGYLSPTTLDTLTGGMASAATETVELFPEADFLAIEG